MNRILPGRPYTLGTATPAVPEPKVSEVSFVAHKFTNRRRPSNPKKILIVCCFSEFGCETVGVTHCLPTLLRSNPGFYVVVAGWSGREYLYRHLADEFWEINEKFQFLREYCRAFHHHSRTLTALEKILSRQGVVFPSAKMGNYVIGNTCLKCGHFWGANGRVPACARCGDSQVERSLFGDVAGHRKNKVPVPVPTGPVLEEAKKYAPDCLKTVGVTARRRNCYGRNLTPEFYINLIEMLEGMGYGVVWLGEKQSTLPCPLPHVPDLTRTENRLDLTLAVTARCEFTVQFWTASTRLAAMVGVPYLLFESPDQIVGRGQEGLRMALLTEKNKKKLVLCQYLKALADPNGTVCLTRRAMEEMAAGDWSHVLGPDVSEKTKELLLEKDPWRFDECS